MPMLASLDLGFSMLCALLWAYSCAVTSTPLVAYWGVTTCEAHPHDADLLDAYLFFALCDVACHAFFMPPVWLSLLIWILFTHLPTCSCMSLCLLVPSILQSNGTVDIRSKPAFILLGHPRLPDNILVCPFTCLACFVCPYLALFECVLCMLSLFPLFLPLLVCRLVSFVFSCTYMEHGHLEQGVTS